MTQKPYLHEVKLKFEGIEEEVNIKTFLPNWETPILYAPENDEDPVAMYLNNQFGDTVFVKRPEKIYSHAMFQDGQSKRLQYTAKGKGPWLEKATADYVYPVRVKGKGLEFRKMEQIPTVDFLPVMTFTWKSKYIPIKGMTTWQTDVRYVQIRQETFRLRVLLGFPQSEEASALIEVFFFVLLETKTGLLQLVAFGFCMKEDLRGDFTEKYQDDSAAKNAENTGETKQFETPEMPLNTTSDVYHVQFDFAIKDISGDARGKLEGPLSREKPLVFLPTYSADDDQPRSMISKAARTFLHDGKLQELIFRNEIQKKNSSVFSSAEEEDINPDQRTFFYNNSGPILQSCTIVSQSEYEKNKKISRVDMLPLLGVNEFGEYVDASTVTNWKKNMMTILFDIPYRDTKQRDTTIKAVLIPLWSMKDKTFGCFYVCIPTDKKNTTFRGTCRLFMATAWYFILYGSFF